MFMRTLLQALIICCICNSTASSQSIDTVQFSHVSQFLYEAILPYSSYSCRFDDQERPYLYTANVELGVVVFDISDIQNPIPVDTVLPSELGGLKPTNLWHQNGLLYASVGGIQGLAQDAGLAIFDVSDLTDLSILDVWTDQSYSEGAAIVIVDGDYAYLGAMELGVVILDVSDPSAVLFVGHAELDPNFPQVPGLFSTPNARGMSIRNDTLVVANDAGGLRMVDVTDKQNPVELSKYINPDMDAVTQSAYNNVLLVDEYAYIPVDYCGLDVVNVADTAMFTENWLNPWGCNGTNWNGAEGHSNEIVRVSDDLVFMSGGDAELLAYDISVRTEPELVGAYTFPYDSVVAWGVTANSQHVVLSLVNNSVFQQPYYSDVGGIMILEWNMILGADERTLERLPVYPNPTDEILRINHVGNYLVEVYDLLGRPIYEKQHAETSSIDVSHWKSGVYIVSIRSEKGQFSQRLVVH